MPSDIDRAFNYESYRSSVTLHYLLSGFNTDIAVQGMFTLNYVHLKLFNVFFLVDCSQYFVWL